MTSTADQQHPDPEPALDRAMTWADIAPQLTGQAHIATVRADGSPHVAVVAPLVEGQEIWIFTRRSSRKARNLAADGRIALMWRPQSELYVYGRAQLIDDPATKARLWATEGLQFDPAGFFGSADHPDFVVIRVIPERAIVIGPTGRTTWNAP
jgi:general stress protein 26